jgi:hypothetical protein
MGKSQLAKTAILHKICFNTSDRIEFIPWVCEVQTQSKKHVRYIKDHIEFNERIHKYFPHVKPGKVWTATDFETIKGDKIFAVGMEQKLRGGVHKGFRYTGVHLDDFEGEHNTKTPESRQKNKEFIASAVFPSLEETRGYEGWIWLSGTIVHYDSFLQGVYDHWQDEEKNNKPHVWSLRFFSATDNKRLDDTSIALWRDRFSVPILREKKDLFESAGAVHKFAQEYMNDARDESSAPIQVSKIRNHFAQLEVRDGQPYLLIGGFDDNGTAYLGNKVAIPVYIYMGVDPAQVVGPRTDFSVIYILAVDGSQRRWTLEIYRERVPGFQLFDKMMELGRKYPLSRVNPDPTGGSEWMVSNWNRMSAEEKRILPGLSRSNVKYPRGIDKAQRNIDALAPPIHSGLWYMRPEHKSLLSDELWELPSPKYDDVTDGGYLAEHSARRRYPRAKAFEAKELGPEDIPPYIPNKPVKNWRSQNIWGGRTWRS